MSEATLALLGGPKTVQTDPTDTYTWPIITKEDEDAVLEVLRRGAMSGFDVTEEFEREFAEWHEMNHAVAHSTGTGALEAAMWACGVRTGDEIIAPSLTYWATALPAFNLKASIVFAEVDPNTMCLDPNDLEHRITKRTKAIVPVHYCGYPADMDPIMEIAERHGVKVIEDVSHAHGGHYKGRLVGTIGHCNAMSCMSGKSLAIGEGGMLLTNDQEMFEHAIAWGHYGRSRKYVEGSLKPYVGLPLGGHKYRMHQLSATVGRVQLKHYHNRMAVIQKSMNYFWDLLEGVPGVKAHRPPQGSGSDCGGWYAAHGLYVTAELDNLPISWFCQAVAAEGAVCSAGCNFPLHTHPLLQEVDVYGDGKPTIIAHSDRDLRQPTGSLPVTESMPSRCYNIPWFKHYRPRIIEEQAAAYRKVAEHADEVAKHFQAKGEAAGKVSGSAGLFNRT